jgi:hypothetical protein
MSRNFLAYCFAVAGSFVAAALCIYAPVEEPVPDVVKPANPPRLNPDRFYVGTIATIGADWLTLSLGWKASESKTRPKLEDEGKKPLGLKAGGAVAAGKPVGFGYRLTDLQVGDVVFIQSGLAPNGDVYCQEIWIQRRPKGKIPPVPGEPFSESGTHLRYQAEQDWEEKGTPIPKSYLDPDGRAQWTNPPYPPVAPQPRSGVPRAIAPAPRKSGPPPIPLAKP